MTLISLAEYAEKHGRNPGSVRQMALRGSFETARKIGRNWVIEDDEPYPDNRIKNGDYVNWRKGQGTMKNFGELILQEDAGNRFRVYVSVQSGEICLGTSRLLTQIPDSGYVIVHYRGFYPGSDGDMNSYIFDQVKDYLLFKGYVVQDGEYPDGRPYYEYGS